ncbi:hypothetical protein NBRC10513v2_005380 [Rhodotorula toruloides]|uniref:Uncharacterized protein n=1 Tax=Rhodotorula toruloides TaxID=5286 RepID=A0A0K3CJG6_RHOTO|nr:hypothetical protein AAT19DRAFT_9871 [Rhodotorula toruloides]
MPLSASTRGLKFMNRAQPTAPAAPAASAPLPSAAKSSKAVETPKASGAKQNGTGKAVSVEDEARIDEVKKGDEEGWAGRRVVGSGGRPTIIQESSLLSFPMLSTLSSKKSTTTTTFASATATYSSMPLTSSTVSGRRSYGGANVEIEKLNDPSSHQPADSPSTSSSKPRRSKADRAAAIVPVRRSGSSSVLSSSKAGKRTAALDAREGEGEGGKKRRKTEDEEELRAGGLRWDDGDEAGGKSGKKQGFARPAGFEGVKKGGVSKGKGRARQGDLMDAEGSFKWAKKGEMREWDEGKDDSSDEEDGELLDMSGDGTSSDEEEEEDASEVEEMLLQASAAASKQDKQRQGKTRQERDKRRQEVERAVEREEARRQFGGAGGSKKAKSRR